jgi:peroxiredoxin Q/BCP
MIGAGQPAPDFTLPSTAGELRLSSLYPSKVVVFFYPGDNTPTCTIEATDFSARAADFASAATRLVGISKDSLRKHVNFRKKYDLDLILAVDDAGVCEAWGVWGWKQMFGRDYEGIIRSTALIGGDGIVRQAWSPVRVPGHVDEVLAAARAA